jgi:2-keto-4-pentenoate hydratase
VSAVQMSENQKITGFLGDDEAKERSRHRREVVNPLGETHAILARALWDAEHNMAAIEPISSVIPDLSVADGYAIRREVDLLRMIDGAVPVGRKVGMATRQLMLRKGLDEPFWSYVFSTGEVPDHSTIDLRNYIQPKIEAEIALVLGEDMDDPNLTPETAMAAISAFRPAIEVVDVRSGGWDHMASEAIADSGLNAGFVLGPAAPNDGSINPDAITVRMRSTNVGPSPLGRSSELAGGPLGILVWLAKKLLESGEPLRAGEVVLTGTLTPPVTLEAGQSYTAEFAGFGNVLGIVRIAAK